MNADKGGNETVVEIVGIQCGDLGSRFHPNGCCFSSRRSPRSWLSSCVCLKPSAAQLMPVDPCIPKSLSLMAKGPNHQAQDTVCDVTSPAHPVATSVSASSAV